MANENKDKTQGGKIKTMQHDLERIKNPAPSFASVESAPNIHEETASTPQPEQGASASIPIKESKISEEPPTQEKPLEDPALEKLFNLEIDESSSISPVQTPQERQHPDSLSTSNTLKEPVEDISSAVSSLRQELPRVEQEVPATQSDSKLKADIGDSLAKLKGFGSEMESDDENTASVGSQAAKINEIPSMSGSGVGLETPSMGVKPKNPYSRIDDIRAKDSTPNVSQDLTPEITESSKSSKQTLLLIGLVVILVSVIGGGGYYFFFSSNNNDEISDQTTEPNTDTSNEITDEEIDNLVDPLQPDTIIQVTPTANIRADIITALQSQPTEVELAEIFLVDESQNKVTLDQIESQLTISIPTEIRDNLSDYMLVAVRDNGRFEIGSVLELQDNVAESYLQTWQDTVIQDLSGFSLSQNAPSVPSEAKLQSIEKTQLSTGETFTNYFYNYEQDDRSTDITAKDNIIMIGTTQGVMEYLIQNVFIR